MAYGGVPYAGGAFGGQAVAAGTNNGSPALAVEVAFTTGALETPAWVDITPDVREWDTRRGRNRELERFQPGRATIVLDNRDRRYDSNHATGPWFGNLKPMRRVRIRETFNGVTYPVFDGYVDKWQLDYGQYGKDATATIIATDAFKIFNRTDLPKSVYASEVEADSPELWWRLDDPQFLFSAVDASGNEHTGTPEGNVRFGSETIIFHDPGSSVGLDESADCGISASLSLNGANPFAFEFWFRWEEQPAASSFLAILQGGGNGLANFQINPSTNKGAFAFRNDAGTNFSAQPNFVFVVGARYHIVCTHASDRVLRVFINGAEQAYDVQETTTGATTLTTVSVGSTISSISNKALYDEFAVYTTVPSDARILAHFNAGIAPWNGDLPGARADRILDLVEWPDDLRELDTGATSLQSAALGTSALEHLQKVGETEFGLFFMDRAGNVRLVSRDAVFGREPPPVVFGDGAGEVAYRDIKFNDGDEVIRNRASIGQLNGVPAVAENAASVTEFGRFDYTLDGLYHDSLSFSQDYANFIASEYKDPRRRVTSLTLGPATLGAEADLYPQMLGRELGDAIEVKNRPPGGGDAFEQTCVIEGIRHQGVPPGHQTTTWTLSPEFGGIPMFWTDYTPTNTNITVGNGTQVARYARSGNTVLWTYTLTFGSNTSFDGTIEVGLPVAAEGPAIVNLGSGWAQDSGTAANTREVTTFLVTAGGSLARVVHAGGGTATNATTPFTWATGDRLTIVGLYQAAA